LALKTVHHIESGQGTEISAIATAAEDDLIDGGGEPLEVVTVPESQYNVADAVCVKADADPHSIENYLKSHTLTTRRSRMSIIIQLRILKS
jgi:hypothetical protein